MAKTLIQVENLVKNYHSRRVVNGICFTVEEGEIVALIGPNGAGKTTTIEMILGIRRPDGGEVKYWCEDPRSQIGVQLQSTPFFPGLSTRENVSLFAAFYGIRLSHEEISRLLERYGLQGVEKVKASRLSGGQQKRLAIAIALVHQPKLVFLDEPTAALDPRARHEIRQLIVSLADKGTSVVFSSHDIEEVEKMADRVILLDQGTIKAIGTPQELLEKYKTNHLEDLYLKLTAREDV